MPATETLQSENIFVITETRAITQDIRPLKIAILNLMPTKITTETQLARLLGNSPLQVELELLHTASHEARNTAAEHMLSFYRTYEDVKDEKFDEPDYYRQRGWKRWTLLRWPTGTNCARLWSGLKPM